MLTYQVRPRVFRTEPGQKLPFPDDGDVRFHFLPLQPFGMEAGGGRTAVRAVEASVLFDANSGTSTIESKTPLDPLQVVIEEPGRTVRLDGNVLTISQHFDRNQALTELIEGIYFAMPTLLSVEFADSPYIERVDGTIGSISFRWELQQLKIGFRTTTQQQQETTISTSWKRMGVLSVPGRRRLVAALHYFYVATRLSRVGSIAGEFLPEVILNYAKVLEVLFPPSGDGRTRDAARNGLAGLGFSKEEIEADYLPAMALRNDIDVAHVDLSLFNREQLILIHAYIEHAEETFRVLLNRVLSHIEQEKFDVEPYEPKSADPKGVAVVKRLQKHAKRYAL